MARTSLAATAVAWLALGVSLAGLPTIAPSRPEAIHAVLAAAFPQAPAAWAGRIIGDETMEVCSATDNKPSPAFAKAIEAKARASIVYPPDGGLMGDWREGEKIAQSGYGLRFTDEVGKRPNGGNCYACHQLTAAEIAYGTIGPSLLAYGRDRKLDAAEVKAAYDKIYNSHATLPCSLMPRFGANGVLTVEQVRHLTALLMSPDSPVNK